MHCRQFLGALAASPLVAAPPKANHKEPFSRTMLHGPACRIGWPPVWRNGSGAAHLVSSSASAPFTCAGWTGLDTESAPA